MGSKNNPGQFDCYANAAPDEPMFVLLGRDRHAAVLVHLWAVMRHAAGEDLAKVHEAINCANSMVDYRSRLKPGEVPAGIAAAANAVVQLAVEAGCVITVDHVPLQPLAMGNYQHRVHIRPARESARAE